MSTNQTSQKLHVKKAAHLEMTDWQQARFLSLTSELRAANTAYEHAQAQVQLFLDFVTDQHGLVIPPGVTFALDGNVLTWTISGNEEG